MALKTATVAGEIRALSIDRGSGAVLVATTNPNTVVRIDLTSLAVKWTANLSGVPTAVAPMATSVIVGIGTGLWLISGQSAVHWATARQPVLALAASDEGSVLHVEEKNAIEVFGGTGTLQRTLELSADRTPVAMAAVPAGSSLSTGSANAVVAATPTGHLAAAIGSSKPPSTSTIVDNVSAIASERPVQGAVAVGRPAEEPSRGSRAAPPPARIASRVPFKYAAIERGSKGSSNGVAADPRARG